MPHTPEKICSAPGSHTMGLQNVLSLPWGPPRHPGCWGILRARGQGGPRKGDRGARELWVWSREAGPLCFVLPGGCLSSLVSSVNQGLSGEVFRGTLNPDPLGATLPGNLFQPCLHFPPPAPAQRSSPKPTPKDSLSLLLSTLPLGGCHPQSDPSRQPPPFAQQKWPWLPPCVCLWP